jgi:hypothetical protein
MPRTITAISFAIATLVASGAFAGARAEVPAPRMPTASCQDTSPIVSPGTQTLGGAWIRDGVVGGDGTTGLTVPFICRQST